MLNLSGFVTGEQDWGGLAQISQNIGRENALKEQQEKSANAQRLASTKFLVDYLDPKEFLTGTPNDPYYVKQVSDLTREGMELIGKGVSDNQLLMALSPKVGRLSQEVQILKGIAEQRKMAQQALAKNPAIDMDKFNAAFEEVFYEQDEFGRRKLKDISKIDPTVNYADEIIKNKNVFTAAGVDEFVKNAGANTRVESAVITDSRGGKRAAKLETVRPSFMQLNINPITKEIDKDEEFVPKFELAQDEQQPLLAEFMTKNNRVVKAPVRLLAQNVFNSLMENKNAAAYILAKSREYANEIGVSPTSAKVELFARAYAYDLLKNSGRQKSSYKEFTDTKEAPAPRTTTNIYTGDDGSKQQYVDAYDDIWTKLQNYKPGENMPMTEVPPIVFNDFIRLAKSASVTPALVTASDVFIQNVNGEMTLMLKEGNKFKPVVKLPKSDVNRMYNPKDKGTTNAINRDTKTGKPKEPTTSNNSWDKYKRN